MVTTHKYLDSDTNGTNTLNFHYISQIENIRGTNGIDLLMGKHGENNWIMAGAGNDTIFLSTGINHIDGEAGNNWISLPKYEWSYF